jgi:hypothetical protein
MSWIQLHQSLIKHPKTTKAAELLHMDKYKFVGHLVCFWLWALDYADINGDLPANVSEKTLGDSAGVSKVFAKKFVSALIQCGPENQAGFLELIEGRFHIHDWRDFAGKLLEKRIENKERMYNARALHKTPTNTARAGARVEESRTNTNVLVDETQKIIIEKKKYGEFANVMLTDDELEKVKVKFPDDHLSKIEELSVALKSRKGYAQKYSDHYATILSWARRNADSTHANPEKPVRKSPYKYVNDKENLDE